MLLPAFTSLFAVSASRMPLRPGRARTPARVRLRARPCRAARALSEWCCARPALLCRGAVPPVAAAA